MRLPDHDTCPSCNSLFRGTIEEVVRDDFTCPSCGSNMPELKAEYRHILFTMDITSFLITLFKGYCIPISQENRHRLIECTSLTANELGELVSIPLSEHEDTSLVISLKQKVQQAFIEAFGTDTIDIRREYAQHFHNRHTLRQRLLQKDPYTGKTFSPGQTFMLHSSPYYSPKTQRSGVHLCYFPKRGTLSNEIYVSANEAYQGYLRYQDDHLKGYVTIFSEAYCMPISEQFLEKLRHVGYSLQTFQAIERQEIDKFLEICSTHHIAVYINESAYIDGYLDEHLCFQSAPWRRLN